MIHKLDLKRVHMLPAYTFVLISCCQYRYQISTNLNFHKFFILRVRCSRIRKYLTKWVEYKKQQENIKRKLKSIKIATYNYTDDFSHSDSFWIIRYWLAGEKPTWIRCTASNDRPSILFVFGQLGFCLCFLMLKIIKYKNKTILYNFAFKIM